MYGSNFCIVTLKLWDCNSFAKDAAIIPLPNDEVTPPVTKIYLVGIRLFSSLIKPDSNLRKSG